MTVENKRHKDVEMVKPLGSDVALTKQSNKQSIATSCLNVFFFNVFVVFVFWSVFSER